MDWTTSLQALADKARSSYRHVIGEWQDLLRKVARGEVPPEVLEDRLPQFLQDEGADFYRRLSALSFELFNGLSALQASGTNEFIRGLLGDAAVEEAPAPSAPAMPEAGATPEVWSRWYQEVTAFLTEQNEVALRRYQGVLEKVADGRLTPAGVQEFSRKFIHERALVFSRDAGELQMRFYTQLLQLNQEFMKSLFAGLARNASAAETEPPLRIQTLEPEASPMKATAAAASAASPAVAKRANDEAAPAPAAPAGAKRKTKSTAGRRRKKATR